MTNQTCPDHALLSDYSLGHLAEDVSRNVEDHLESCSDCQSVMIDSDVSVDPLLDAFPSVGRPCDPIESEPEMQHGLETVLVDGTVTGKHVVASTPAFPERLRDYRLLRELGRGGMGAVFEAVHERLDRTVAIKVLSAGLVADDQARARFEREMKAVGRLDDPHIVRATDAGEDNGMHYLVMEFVDGVDVGALLKCGAMPVPTACDIVRQAALGLVTIHANGLVHRDVKPANLIVTRSGEVKLLDLGLALLQQGPLKDDGLTNSGQIMGTVDYMAPEQITNTHTVDERADLYSLGCVFHHLLSGRPPYDDGSNPSAFEKLKFHLERDPADLASLRTDIPESVKRLVARLVEKDPERRDIRPGELATALEPLAAESNLSTVVADGPRADSTEPAMQSSLALTGADTVAVQGLAVPAGNGSRSSPRVRRLLLSVVAAIAVLLSGMVYFNTGKGAVEIRVNETNVTILIDGESPQGMKSDGGAGAVVIRIPVSSGSHEITIGKSGFAEQKHTVRVLRHLSTPLEITIEPRQPERAFAGHSDAVLGLALSPDGSRVLSASADNTLRLWSTATGELIQTLRGHTDDVRSVSFLADGKRALSASADQTIRLWDVNSGKLLRQYTGHTDVVTGVSPSEDQASFVSSGFDGLLQWDIEQATPVATLGYQHGDDVPEPESMDDLKTLEGHVTWVRSAEFSPDGQMAVSGGNDALVAVWDIKARKIRQHLIGHRAPVSIVRFTPDLRRVITGGFDNRVLVFETADGSMTRQLDGHTAPIRGLCVSRDGKQIAATASSRIIVWNAETFAEVARMEFDSDIMSMTSSTKQKTLIVGFANGRIERVQIDESRGGE